MRILSTWTAIVLTATSAFANAGTFQNPEIDELYTQENQPELYCLAQNIYFESKSEPLAGQYAVADVVLNRVQDTRFPNTICEVVREGPIKESWKTKQHADLPDSERIYHPIKHRCNSVGIVMARLILFEIVMHGVWHKLLHTKLYTLKK